MIGLIIITHEMLGAAYTTLARHFFPNKDLSYVRILNVETTDDHADIIARVQTMLPESNQGNGVLILTDIFGATPCNAVMKLIQPHQSAMVTGLNAPMLIKAVNYAERSENLAELTQLVHDAGVQGVMSFVEPLA